MSLLNERIHTHRYTATVAVAAFSTQQQRNEPSLDAYTTHLLALSPPANNKPHCTVSEYVDIVTSYADMYDAVHETTVMLIGAVLAECGRVLAAASSMSAEVAAVQWKYVMVWRSGCGRDSDRERRLDVRWKADREWRKAQSSRAAERKSVTSDAAGEPKSDTKKKQSKPKS